MSKNSAKISKYISVFIPTFNGEKYLGECLEAILHQELPAGYGLEVIVIDSGSTDGTLQILEAYKSKITFKQIPNSEFGHGKTRQQAAEMAKGEYFLCLSQDATPAHYRWIINMIEPFFLSDRVGCVFGRQQARRDAAATIKREVNTVFGGICGPDGILIHRHKSLVDGKETNPLSTFYSDVNSAARRDLLVGGIPFRDVKYAEDQALAEDMQTHGYLKAYAPLGEVWHSNEYTVHEYFKRKFDEYIGLQESLGHALVPSRRSLLLGWIRPTIADYKFIRRDGDYGAKSKLLWFAKAPLYNMAMQRGKYKAGQHLHNNAARKKLSLEAGRRK
ncbi:MAG TPA: glycosyltransferase family 2 protein [Candidatus Saccharimonadales bacterium]|nr:glycosyltransferase family 2 protein [Candidatus Saccharimonadales bacterium]